MKRVLALALAAMATTYCSKPAVEEVTVTGPMTVQVADATLELIQTSITATGTVTPSPGTDWTINAPETGRVVEMPKAEGDAVQAGDLLVRFEIPSLTSAVIASQTEVIQTSARLATARSAVTRLSGLVARGIAPQRDLDDAQRELQEAEAAVRNADGGREAADLLAARMVIRARFAGVVARRWHNPGDSVEGSAADPVLRVIDPARLEVTVSVPAAELALITPGNAVKVFNPSDGSTIPGAVIARPLLLEGAAPSGEVRVSMASLPASLMPGSPIQVEIVGDSRATVLVVPSTAVFRLGELVFVVVAGEDGKAHHKNVMTGIQTRDRTQIVSGLLAGEKVILSGADPVPDGTSIAIGR